MMLRRTNALQVVPVYLEAIRRYPDPKALAFAPSEEVVRVLRPLGLAWRAENIRKMAEVLVERFNGHVPNSYKELNELPGVGDYVASAVLCFAFDEPVSIIDTNTVRVAGRYFGFETHPESRRRKPVREAIVAVTSQTNTRSFNMAFLDFASLVCRAADPRCSICPVRSCCVIGQKQVITAI